MQLGLAAIVARVKRRGVWIIVAVVAVVIAALSWGAYSQARQFEALAKAGRTDVSAAMKSLNAQDMSGALASFQQAKAEFGQARDLLGPDWVQGVPWLGHQLVAANHLTTIGLEASSAGAEVTQLVSPAGQTVGKDRITQALASAGPHLDAALTSLTVIAARADSLSAEGLVPPLADAVQQVHGMLKPIEPLLTRSQALLTLERFVFSADHRFLLLSQNNTQLRPSGGFLGTYGVVSLGPSGFRLDRFEDVYKLPGARSDMPVPAGMGTRRVYFHLANWWLDFPTTGRTMVELWDTVTPPQPSIDGVIAIDLPTIRNLLEVFGPISVPEVNGQLTADNVFERLSNAVQVEYSGGQGDKGKKNAVISLSEAVMDHLLTLSDKEFAPILQALATSANEKHVQFFLTDSVAQAATVAVGWAGAIAPSDSITDVVAVANSVMRSPAKSNLGVSKKLSYDSRSTPTEARTPRWTWATRRASTILSARCRTASTTMFGCIEPQVRA